MKCIYTGCTIHFPDPAENCHRVGDVFYDFKTGDFEIRGLNPAEIPATEPFEAVFLFGEVGQDGDYFIVHDAKLHWTEMARAKLMRWETIMPKHFPLMLPLEDYSGKKED